MFHCLRNSHHKTINRLSSVTGIEKLNILNIDSHSNFVNS